MKYKIFSRSQRGDTIIEVLLAVAIIGMVIGASYATANRALRTGRFAQEQTEAVKLAESQLEELKYIASLNPKSVPTPAKIFDPAVANRSFCVTSGFAKIIASSATYNANCKDQGSGQLYTILDTYEPNPADGGIDLFTITITWDRAGSSLKGNEQIAYRLHQ